MNKKLRIHLFSKRGMYIVDDYNRHNIFLSTNNHRPNFIVPSHDFNEFAGGINYTNKETEEDFLSIVSPKRFRIRILEEQEGKHKLELQRIREIMQESYNKRFTAVKRKYEDELNGMTNKAELMEQLYRASLEEIENINGKCPGDIEHEFENHWDVFIKHLTYAKKMGFPSLH